MNTGERLAAYLSGDLDTDERTALEADLAGDPALRDHLERIRASDAALADLPEVDLPEGFSARLRERVAPEVDAVVGDELASRRARRGTPAWLPALGAAAALAVVVAGGVTLAGGMGGDDSTADMAEEAGPRTMAGDSDDGGGADTMMRDAETEAAGQVTGPLVTDRGRTLGPDDLQQLVTDPEVQAALESDAVQADPTVASDEFLTALGGASTETETAAENDDAAEAQPEQEADLDSAPTAASRAPVADLLRREGVSDADLDAVAECLSVLSEGAAAPVVPLYVELATDEDGEEVIVYVALAQDADDEYERVEVWMVSRDDCEPRQFVQGGT